ncbi:ribbon-helix-helix protein, CopG family [Histophilus somni]|uniref:ribbon-helix-helix protein, CopG family n=1 Tax=Histophilus somni TaxID=731 RepID=UPI00201EFC9D|nr:ribbon-helix-helix protein, CopG family [Histophilus somni]
MATTNAERVAKSDAKRGIKLKAFKLPLEVIGEIEQISQQLGIPQNQLIIQALECFKQANK